MSSYRLIGYANRTLAHRDFADDKKDAGEIGAGHTVTALYEVIPADLASRAAIGKRLKYQKTPPIASSQTLDKQQSTSPKCLTVSLRNKPPKDSTSKLIEQALIDKGTSFDQASVDFRFAASVAAFGFALRQQADRGSASFETALKWATESIGSDLTAHRSEFLSLLREANKLSRNR